MELDAVGNDAEHHHHSGEAARRALSQRAIQDVLKNPFGEAVRREREEEWN